MLNDSSSAMAGLILPTFRPDALLDIKSPSWRFNVAELGDLVNMTIKSFEVRGKGHNSAEEDCG